MLHHNLISSREAMISMLSSLHRCFLETLYRSCRSGQNINERPYHNYYQHYIDILHRHFSINFLLLLSNDLKFYNDLIEKILFPFSVDFLSPLQYEFISPFRPVQEDKFVNALIEHTCLTFCLQVTD